jgi:hypothetical protein
VRYYVLRSPNGTNIPPHVIAETAREDFDDGAFRDTSLAGTLAADGVSIVTRQELCADPAGRRALAMWEMGDDWAFHAEMWDLWSQDAEHGTPPLAPVRPERDRDPRVAALVARADRAIARSYEEIRAASMLRARNEERVEARRVNATTG